MLELVGVVLTEDGVARLKRFDLAARPGEVLGLVGPSGAGKTAALEVAAGLKRVARGRILFEGREVSRRPERLKRAGALLGEVSAGPGELSVGRWLGLWAELDGVARSDRKVRLEDAAACFGVADLGRRIDGLSRGERRRVSLARVWARAPAIYLLDAPDDGLDGAGLRALTTAIRAVATAGATVVLTGAAPHLPAAVCDRVLCVADGAVTLELSRGDADFQSGIARAAGWVT